MLTLATWGFLVPFVWGFSSRWVPIFLGLRSVNEGLMLKAVGVNSAGILLHAAGFTEEAMLLLLTGSLLAVLALHIFASAERAAKTLGVHRSFPAFVRIAYGWLLISAILAVFAAFVDRHHGWWGATRHAITVGFISTMVVAIGQRVLPAFAGMRRLFSPRLMLLSLLLLEIGCALRVTGHILAYESVAPSAWSLLAPSAVLEMTAVVIFACNMVLTFRSQPPHISSLSSAY